MSEIITHNNNGQTFLLVKVPEDARVNITNVEGLEGKHICLNIPYPFPMRGFKLEYFQLPEGSWQLFGKADELTEEQCETMHPDRPWLYEPICRTNFINYKDALQIVDARYRSERTAKESLASLLASHSLNPSTTIILQSTKTDKIL